MAVEVVILTPVLMMFVMLIAAGGRYVAVQGDIQATARDAVRAASLERSAAEAHAAASSVMQQSLDDATNCRPLALSGFAPGGIDQHIGGVHKRLEGARANAESGNDIDHAGLPDGRSLAQSPPRHHAGQAR